MPLRISVPAAGRLAALLRPREAARALVPHPAGAVAAWWKRRVASVPLAALSLSLLTVVLAGITVNLLTGATLLANLVPGLDRRPWATLAAVAAALFASAVALYHKRGDFQPVRSLSERPASSRRGLVFLLSPPNLPLETADTGFRVGGVPLTGTDLEADVRALDAVRWTWQQLLRALLPHRASAEHVYLIGSEEHPSSFPALADAERLIRGYLPENVQLHRVPRAVKFERFQELLECVDHAVAFLRGKGLSRSDIVVDVTGGQKTASIAGAVITLNGNVTFQYVRTNAPCEAMEYDLEIRSSSLV